MSTKTNPILATTYDQSTANKHKNKYCGLVVDKTRLGLFTIASCVAEVVSGVLTLNKIDTSIQSRKIEGCTNIDKSLLFEVNFIVSLLPSVIYNFFYTVMTTHDANI